MAMTKRIEIIEQTRRCVVKIGSALLTCDGSGLDTGAMASWVKQIAAIRDSGIEVVLVSSGSVAEGVSRMGWKKRPTSLYQLQAAAAIGQAGLIQAYQSFFDSHGLQTAQVLLTHEDLSHRRRYLNAQSTLKTLLSLKTIPIVNENDTVSFDEIRFGDNDTLGALVSNLVGADLLIILTDQQGLYDSDPRQNEQATFIHEDEAMNADLLAYAGDAGTQVGTGGMRTKVLAAQRAARSGCATIIASGREQDVLSRIMDREALGTFLHAGREPLVARKQWIANQLKPQGQLTIDLGAEKALNHAGRSLLPVGVVKVAGKFERGDVVECMSLQGIELAKGLVNYSSAECALIKGLSSRAIADVLGYVDEEEIIHRDNLVIL